MIRIEYTELGRPISDFDCIRAAENVAKLDNLNYNLEYSTSNIFNAIRMLIVQDVLDYNNIVFIYKGEELKPNKYGAIVDWPKGFCDIDGDIAWKILRCALDKKYKTEYK